jgi:2,3,4,5-tetrahydropyridine-2,6-dicarboxylate N-succinyltransferase
MELKQLIEKAWEDRTLLQQKEVQEAVRGVVASLDKGELRVAEPQADGWKVNEWIKKAVIMYFPIQQMETIEY